MTIRISLTIPEFTQGKFGMALPDDVDASAVGELVANTLRIVRGEEDAPSKRLVELALDAASIKTAAHTGERKAGELMPVPEDK